uniref:Uncharacterized protein n=1 Tax=Oryza glumipatula TaxID=40148 RepID=A0A0E0AL47_9ORYZ
MLCVYIAFLICYGVLQLHMPPLSWQRARLAAPRVTRDDGFRLRYAAGKSVALTSLFCLGFGTFGGNGFGFGGYCRAGARAAVRVIDREMSIHSTRVPRCTA